MRRAQDSPDFYRRTALLWTIAALCWIAPVFFGDHVQPAHAGIFVLNMALAAMYLRKARAATPPAA